MAHAKILIVEDESIVARDLQRRLIHLGYDVVGAVPTGEEAIKKSSILLPDLILMDVRLKGELDGIEAATEIRTRYGIPSIYLSAYADNDTLKRASTTEPFGYLLKPFEERELHTTIEMALYRNELEQKIKENEAWYGTTLRSLGEAVIATNTNGAIRFMNAAAESLTGWRLSEGQGQDLFKVFQTVEESAKGKNVNPVEQILKNKVTAVLKNHAVLISRDRKEIPIDESASPIKDERGITVGVVLVFQDVSERKRNQEALRSSQEYSQNIISSSLDMIVAVDLDRNIVEFNKAAEKTFGYKKEEVLGKHIDILYADHAISTSVNKTMEGDGQGVMQIFNRRKNGEVFPALLSSAVLKNARGEKIGFMGVSRDITDVRKAEGALKAAQEYAQNIVDSSLDMIIAADKDQNIMEFNHAAEETFGYTAQEIIGKPISVLYRDQDESASIHAKTIENGTCIQEVVNCRKNGEVFQSLLSASVLKNAEGTAIGMMGVSRDITQVKRAQEALRESEERYRAIVNLMPDPILVHTAGKMTFVNSAAVKAFAAESPDELIGKDLLDLVHPDCRIVVGERVQKMKANEKISMLEEKFVRLDGTVLEAEISAVPFIWQGVTAVQIILRDLAERKRADQTIRASETKYRTLFENVLDGVYQTTPEGEILTTNPAFAQMLGYESEAELLLINVDEIYANGTDRKKYLEALEKEGRMMNAELTLKRKDGKCINVLENARVVRNKYGEVLFFEGTIRDITELKLTQVALKKSEERFRAFAKYSFESIWAVECEPPISADLPVEEAVTQFVDTAYFSECNDLFARGHGFRGANEMIGTQLKEVVGQSEVLDLPMIKRMIASGYLVENLETHELDKDGSDKYYLNNIVGILERGKVVRVWGSQLDITEQKRNKLMTSIAYRISLMTEASNSLEELSATVHTLLQEVMPAKNFAVALVDSRNTVTYSYYADELQTKEQSLKMNNPALGYVLREGQSLLLTPELLLRYEREGKKDFSGMKSTMWLGVPLQMGDRVFGALVVNNYSTTQRYDSEQRVILEFVAGQIARMIHYKHSLEELEEKEGWYERVFEENTSPLFIADKDGLLLKCNPALKELASGGNKKDAPSLEGKAFFESAKDKKKFTVKLEQEKNLENYEMEVGGVFGTAKKIKMDIFGHFNDEGKLVSFYGVFCRS
jgi:PAS domain S-box-containing protein